MPSGADIYTAVMSIPGADRALDFLQRQASAFAYVPARLESIRRSLEGIRAAAAARNDVGKVAEVAAALSGLPKLQSLYASTSGKVAEIMTALRVGTADPLALVPKLIATVGQVSLVFKSVDLFEQSVNQLARGAVTSAELTRLRQGGFTPRVAASAAVKWVLLIGGGFLVLKMLGKGRR